MPTTRQQRARWEISHRIEDLADTLQETGHGCQYSTMLVLHDAAHLLLKEASRLRQELIDEGSTADDAAAPGKLV